jgi:hypothetical protein
MDDKMLKLMSVISVSFFMAACSTDGVAVKNRSFDTQSDNLRPSTLTIDGLWVMSNYLDSILEHKSIANYRMQRPAWFAVLIDIEDDVLCSYGTIHDLELPFSRGADTICVFNNIHGNWFLSFNNISQQLELIEIEGPDSEYEDQVYTFNKRPELEFLVQNVEGVHKTRTNFNNYFNDKLFAGTYQIPGEMDSITFSKNGTISGFQDYVEFSVDYYFGTSHPFDNMDNIVFCQDPLIDSRFSDHRYKWSFEGDTLLLTPVLFETKESETEGRIFRTGEWELVNEEIVLIKR